MFSRIAWYLPSGTMLLRNINRELYDRILAQVFFFKKRIPHKILASNKDQNVQTACSAFLQYLLQYPFLTADG